MHRLRPVWSCFIHYGGVVAHSNDRLLTDCWLLICHQKRKAKGPVTSEVNWNNMDKRTLIGARERVSPTEARACNPLDIYFSCKRGCGIPFAIKTALFFSSPSPPPSSILSLLFPPLCLLFTFEVHNFPAAAEQCRLRNSHPLLGAYTCTAWWLPIRVNTSPRSNTGRGAGGKSKDEPLNCRILAVRLKLIKWLRDLCFHCYSKPLNDYALVNGACKPSCKPANIQLSDWGNATNKWP